MSTSPHSITGLTFIAASTHDRERGLLGFASFTHGDLVLDGVAVRRTISGKLVLAYPRRRDRLGKLHPIIRPRDEQARQRIEQSVLRTLGILVGHKEDPT